MIRPRLTFIAGANGAGKTTLTRWNALFQEIPLLDPDAIANTLQATTSMLAPIAAARQVLKSATASLPGNLFAALRGRELAGRG